MKEIEIIITRIIQIIDSMKIEIQKIYLETMMIISIINKIIIVIITETAIKEIYLVTIILMIIEEI